MEVSEIFNSPEESGVNDDSMKVINGQWPPRLIPEDYSTRSSLLKKEAQIIKRLSSSAKKKTNEPQYTTLISNTSQPTAQASKQVRLTQDDNETSKWNSLSEFSMYTDENNL